jgi:membrane protease YdiL (CAAX protease family)
MSVLAAGVGALFGGSVADELLGVLLYVPIAAWVWLVVVRRNGVSLSAMLRWPRLGAYWWIVAGLFLVQLLFSVGAITLTQLVFPGLDDALAGVGEGNLLLALLGLVVLPPLVEEVVFRGVLLERFTIKWRIGVAIIVSSVAFGILHADPVGAGVFGVVTCLLYLRTGSLWPGILIHFANNLLALVATRTVGSDVEAPAPELGEALTSAGVFLGLSVPFLAWFIVRNWPPRGTPTPYQRYESNESGSVPATFPGIAWSGAPYTVRLTVTPTDLIVDRPGLAPGEGQPLAVLPVEQVAAAYPTDIPGGQQVVILLTDGSWSTMRVGPGAPEPTEELAEAVMAQARRARSSDLTADSEAAQP